MLRPLIAATAVGCALAAPAPADAQPAVTDVVAALYTFSLSQPTAFSESLTVLTPQQLEKLRAGLSECLTNVQNADPYRPDLANELPAFVQPLPVDFGSTQLWAADMRRTLVEGVPWGETSSGQVALRFEGAQPLFCAIVPGVCDRMPVVMRSGARSVAQGACAPS